jgi:site-specific DNA-methyltransferase (adenine-specific)
MTTLASEKNNSFIFEKNDLVIINDDGLNILNSLKNGSVDLILTDPPYVISKDSGMNTFEKKVQKIDESGVNVKTEAEW